MGRHLTPAAPALLLLALAPPAEARPPPDARPTLVLQCTPDSVSGPFGSVRTGHPIAAALRRCGPGSVVRLAPGRYRPFSIGVRTHAPDAADATGLPGRSISIVGGPGVVIGGAGATDTIFVGAQVPAAHFLFRGLTIQAGWRSGVMFAAGRVHRGFRFVDCDILGGFDHVRGRGRASKWGVWGWGLADFEFRGEARFARVMNLRDEHAFYLHNLAGDVLIEKVHCARVGRTFLQLTSRSREGPRGRGTVRVRRCRIVDTGLAPGDGHKGGSAITVGGGHAGSLVVENTQVLFGFDEAVRRLTRPGEPYGTGALVVLDKHERSPLTRLVLRDDRFEFHEGCGDRAVVSIGGCVEVRFEGKNRIVAGRDVPALEIDPLDPDRGVPRSSPVRRLVVDPATVVVGAIEHAGRRLSLAALIAEAPSESRKDR